MAVSVSDDFYIILPSNVSDEFYPDNTSDAYRVRLSNHIQLNGQYRCGIATAILPTKWCNITDGSDYFEVRQYVGQNLGEKDVEEKYDSPVRITIPKPPSTYGTWIANGYIELPDYVKWFNERVPQQYREHVSMRIATNPLPAPTHSKVVVVKLRLNPRKTAITLMAPFHFWRQFGFPPEMEGKSYMRIEGNIGTYVKPEPIAFEISIYRRIETPRMTYSFTVPILCDIPHGRYENKAELISKLNSLNPHPTELGFEFKENRERKKIEIVLTRQTEVRISKGLAYILGGFSSDWLEKK
jgi:hypothetical protein